MSFCQDLLRSPLVQDLLAQNIAHPFNQELARGELAAEKFRFYVEQDTLYLVDFGRALSVTAAKLEVPVRATLVLDFATRALTAERSVHAFFFERFGRQADARLAPSALAYTKFLVATAYERSPAVSFAALLPCFWIYREVGRSLARGAAVGNPYAKWIETYAGDDYDEVVRRALGLTDELATEASPATREEMRAVFETSCRMEWMFWEAAYRLETWPPWLRTS